MTVGILIPLLLLVIHNIVIVAFPIRRKEGRAATASSGRREKQLRQAVWQSLMVEVCLLFVAIRGGLRDDHVPIGRGATVLRIGTPSWF